MQPSFGLRRLRHLPIFKLAAHSKDMEVPVEVCTLQVGEGLEAAIHGVAALSQLMTPAEASVVALLSRIRHSIEPDDARILDRASNALGALRERRRENAHTLRREIEDWARRLHAQGVSERAQVRVLRRRRH